MGDLETQIAGALRLAGVETSAEDVQLAAMAHGVYAPLMTALDGADVREMPAEVDLDPGRPPRTRGS